MLVHGCKNTKIPNSVISIGPNAFNALEFNTIEIPSNVTSIGRDAFAANGSLTSIEIPSSVTTIDGFAFVNCNSLTNVAVGRDTPVSISSTVFAKRSNATLYVPSGSIEAYKAANYWKEFKEIVENSNITFADANVKALCVANWDTNHDGELSLYEAATVTDLGEVFKNNTSITSFNELSYFLTSAVLTFPRG